MEGACREIAAFFKTLRQTAEQLTPLQRWCRVLSRALVKYLNGRELRPPPWLPAPAWPGFPLGVYPHAGWERPATGVYCSF